MLLLSLADKPVDARISAFPNSGVVHCALGLHQKNVVTYFNLLTAVFPSSDFICAIADSFRLAHVFSIHLDGDNTNELLPA